MANHGVERIDIQAFDDAIDKLGAVISVFETSAENMNNKTKILFDSWEGKGRDAFQDVYIQMKTAIKDETENLIVIKEDLQAIKASYVNWDTETCEVIGENAVEWGDLDGDDE